MTRLLLILAAVLTLAACEEGGTETQPAASPEATVTEQPDTESAAGTGTLDSERMAHWRAVVKTMTCLELAHLQELRLAVDFNDQAESLVAIHDRQAKLQCQI